MADVRDTVPEVRNCGISGRGALGRMEAGKGSNARRPLLSPPPAARPARPARPPGSGIFPRHKFLKNLRNLKCKCRRAGPRRSGRKPHVAVRQATCWQVWRVQAIVDKDPSLSKAIQGLTAAFLNFGEIIDKSVGFLRFPGFRDFHDFDASPCLYTVRGACSQ